MKSELDEFEQTQQGGGSGEQKLYISISASMRGSAEGRIWWQNVGVYAVKERAVTMMELCVSG